MVGKGKGILQYGPAEWAAVRQCFHQVMAFNEGLNMCCFLLSWWLLCGNQECLRYAGTDCVFLSKMLHFVG